MRQYTSRGILPKPSAVKPTRRWRHSPGRLNTYRMKSRALAFWSSYCRWISVLSAAAGSLLTAGCLSISDGHTVHGSGNVVTEARPVSGFDRVSVSGAGQLKVTQGDAESLTIETDDNLLPYIRSEV